MIKIPELTEDEFKLLLEAVKQTSILIVHVNLASSLLSKLETATEGKE